MSSNTLPQGEGRLPYGWHSRKTQDNNAFPSSEAETVEDYARVLPYSFITGPFVESLFSVVFKRRMHSLELLVTNDTDERIISTAQESFLSLLFGAAKIRYENQVISLGLQYLDIEQSIKLGHQNLLILDVKHKELFRWEPNGENTPIFTYRQREAMDQQLEKICASTGYRYYGTSSCISAPQLKESICTAKLNIKSEGFCTFYSIMFALVYTRANIGFRELENKLRDLLLEEPCFVFDLFRVLNTVCARQLIYAFPITANLLTNKKNLIDAKLDEANIREIVDYYKKPIYLPIEEGARVMSKVDNILVALGLRQSTQSTPKSISDKANTILDALKQKFKRSERK